MRYFAMIDGEQKGPFTLAQLPEAGVVPDTYVWCKGMDNWKQAREVGDICRFYRNRLYNLSHPAPAVAELPEAAEEPEEKNLDDVPLRFRRQIDKAAPDEVDLESFRRPEDLSRKPSDWWPFPMLIAVLFFPPLGILGAVQARKARKAWKEGAAAEAHEYARRGKMAAGMGISFGLIVIASFIPMLF